MVKQNWNIISELWPALFQCKYYEKPSIQKLLDSIFETTNKNFDTFSYTTRLRDSTLNKALNFYPVDSANDLSRLEVFEKRVKETNELVQNLARKIIEITNQSQSIWKTQAICFGTLIFLIYPFGKLNSEFVKTFVDSLVHENIVMRKIAIAGMCIIVNVTKFEKPKTEFLTNDVIKDENIVINKACLGERSDNEWHNLDNDKFKIPETDNEWSEIKFIDKTYYGYYCWPSKIKVNQSKRKFFSNNDPDDALMPIYKNFKDENYIQNLFKMLTIEEEKGKEKFDLKIFHLFKGIFRNFGEMLIPNLIERLKTLVRDRKKDTHECSHRLASEIVSALIRGSKYWPLSKLKQLWFDLKEVFDLIIEHMSPETLYFWHNCFSTAMVS
jgi:proteasome activator subunit 4